MRKEAADLEYAPEDELKTGRTDCKGFEPVMVDLLEPGEDQLSRIIQRMRAWRWSRIKSVVSGIS